MTARFGYARSSPRVIELGAHVPRSRGRHLLILPVRSAARDATYPRLTGKIQKYSNERLAGLPLQPLIKGAEFHSRCLDGGHSLGIRLRQNSARFGALEPIECMTRCLEGSC